MTLTDSPEEAAFLAAVNAQPTDDLPRLIYADWLEEAGFAERAEQIRLQIALAQAKPWDAISIQHLRLDLGSYRRGFPWRMTVYDIPTLIRTLRSNTVPIGAIDIGTCPLNHWEELVALPEFQRIEEIRFTGLTLPIEPLRALRDAPNACNVTTLIFNRSNSLAFPEMIRELYLFPLGPQLKRLEIHFGQSGNEEDLFEAMTEHGQPIALEDFRYAGPLSLHRMNQRDGFLKVVRQVSRLALPGSDLTGNWRDTSFSINRECPLHYLDLNGAKISNFELYELDHSGITQEIKWLDLTNMPLADLDCASFSQGATFEHLATFRLSDWISFSTLFDRRTMPSLLWLDLSCDLTLNSDIVLQYLVRAIPIENLQRITLRHGTLDVRRSIRRKFKSHFGPRLELLERATGGIEV